MTEFAEGDKVRINPDAPRYAGHEGTVKWVLRDETLGLVVEVMFNQLGVRVLYYAAQLELVRAVVAAPRVVTVVL
jgi:hypothetical protein